MDQASSANGLKKNVDIRMEIFKLIKKLSKMDLKDSGAAMLPQNGTVPRAEGAKLPQYLNTIAASLVVFVGGSVIGWTAPSLPYLLEPDSILPITLDEASWIGSLLAIGALIGALPAGTIADLIGRKLFIMTLAIPFLISWAMIYFTRTVSIMYAARLIAGVALGSVCSIVPMYITEIAEDSVRGTLCSYFQLMICLGILYSYTVGAILSYNQLLIACGAVILVFVAAFANAPETPIYLLKRNRRKESQKSLRKLRGPVYNVNLELNALENELNQTTDKIPFMKSIIKRQSVMAMIISLGVMWGQQMSGINVVIFYSASIFQSAGSSLDPKIATILVGLAQVIATLISTILVDKAGRKILLQISSGSMCICLAILGYYFRMKEMKEDVSTLGMLPVVTVLIYILVFGIGFGPIPWMIAGEVFPSEIKGVATGIAVAVNWTLAFTVTKAFQPLQQLIGPGVTYYLFSVICLLTLIFVTCVVIETKGKSLKEIQDELAGKRPSTKSAVI